MLALDLELVKGSILGKHYKVEAFLGEGGFGIVAKCRDTTTNQAVAIKVNKKGDGGGGGGGGGVASSAPW
uniref:Protein kinase domain-containing protein n=1 Tax=Maylandia zebra TaxID=106582 RepID=A0A3P9BWV7_9CICH